MSKSLLILPVVLVLYLSVITAQESPDVQSTTPLTSSGLIQQLTNPKIPFLSETDNLTSTRTINSYQILDNGFLLASTIYQLWMGGVWDNQQKISQTYNTQNWLTEMLQEIWNGTTWITNARAVYTYTGNGFVSRITYQDWNGSDWVNTSRDSYSYNSNNLVSEYLFEVWTGASWVNNYHHLYTYYGNDNLQTQLYQNWNGTSWVNFTKDTYQWNSNDMLTEKLSEYWDGAAWVNNVMWTYAYDANNNPVNKTQFDWNGATWVNYIQHLSTYDSNGNKIEYLNQNWDANDGWVNNWRNSYQYDAMNNQTEILSQDWDAVAMQWVNDWLITNTFNTQNLVETSLAQNCNPGTGWENNWFITYAYDADGNQTTKIQQNWNGTDWENYLKIISTWIPVTGIDDEQFGVKSFQLFNNYPNPFNPSTTIKFFIETTSEVSLIVFDVLGNEVAQLVNRTLERGNYNVQFTQNNLSSGVYFYKLIVKSDNGKENFTDVKKMILMK